MPFSIIAAIATGVASLVIGFVWYGPLFAKAWMQEVGLSEKDLQQGPGVGYLLALVSSSVLGAVTSFLAMKLEISDLATGAVLGALLGAGYVLTTFATNYIFAKKNLRLYLIDGGYQFLLVLVAGIIGALVR